MDWTQVVKLVWEAFWPYPWPELFESTVSLYIVEMHFCLMILVVTGTFWMNISIPISILDSFPTETSKAAPCHLCHHLSFLCSILTASVFIWYHLPLPPNFQKEYLVSYLPAVHFRLVTMNQALLFICFPILPPILTVVPVLWTVHYNPQMSKIGEN